MAYPVSSDFTSPEPFGAWWTYARETGRVDACAASGAGVVAALRRSLGLAAGTSWDVSVLAGMRSRASQLQARDGAVWAPLVVQLTRDEAAGAPSLAGVTFGIWLAYYASAGLRLDAIVVPSNATLPGGGALPGNISDPLVCWDRESDTEPVLLTAEQLRQARSLTQAGVRLRPGESLPTPAQPLPPGEGLSPLQIAGVVAVGAAVIWAVSSMSDTRKKASR